MAGPSPWFEWLSGLVSGLWSRPPAPGSREAFLELQLAGALLSKELLKPPGQRDEEQVHTLLVDYRRRELEHLQVRGGGTSVWRGGSFWSLPTAAR